MLVFRPWLKPAVNRSFQAADAWEGAARAIRTAAQSATSAAVVRGTYPAPSFSITAPCRTRTVAVKPGRGRFTESLRPSHKAAAGAHQCGWKPGGGGEQSRSIIAWSFSNSE